ncbi:MAG: ABC transporter permease [Promethearchaeota archaeon]
MEIEKTCSKKECLVKLRKKERKDENMVNQPVNMIKYIIKRILLIFPMLIFVLITAFILEQAMSVNPTMGYMNLRMEPEEWRAELERIGEFDNVFLKLGKYLLNFFSGDWGTSYVVMRGVPVIQLIARIWPKTIELVIIPIVITPIIAVKLGVLSAKYKNKNKDVIIRFIAILGAGFPIFFIAKVFQMSFFNLRIYSFQEFYVPILYSNRTDYINFYPGDGQIVTGFRIIDAILYNEQKYLWDTLIHLILPCLCTSVAGLAQVSRQTRSSMLDVLDQDYIRTARAKGVQEEVVLNKHALRNALIPTSTLIIGGTAGALLGSLILETTFNYTGLGFYQVRAIFEGDFLVIQGILVFSTIIILSGTLVTDVMYTIIDPRITYT